MYGKIFASMFKGSLYGQWEAIVTFTVMIVLADKHGEVDMTVEALAANTSIPLEIIKKGVHLLEQPDPKSRTPDEEGRRIVRVSDERDWGWTITNYEHYRTMRTAEERREYFRQHKRKQRAKAKGTPATDSPPLSTISPQSPPRQYAVGSKQEAISSSSVERLLSSLPSTADKQSWRAEIAAAEQGAHGKPLTPAQIELACRDYLGNGHAGEKPSLRHFRAFLTSSGLPPKPKVEGKITAGRAALKAGLEKYGATNGQP